MRVLLDWGKRKDLDLPCITYVSVKQLFVAAWTRKISLV